MFRLLRRRPPRCNLLTTRLSTHSFSKPVLATPSPVKGIKKQWWKQHSALEQAYAPGPSLPRIPRDLVLHILRIITNHPQPTFYQVLKEHDAYPQLHSTDSYNLLLDHASSFSNPKYFQVVYRRARDSGMVDENTEQLYVRHLVRHGKGSDATNFLQKAYPDDKVPSAILLELICPPTEKPRTQMVPKSKEYKVGPPKPPPPVDVPTLCTLVETEHGDHVSPMLLASVRYLRYLGQHSEAFDVVNQHINALDLEPAPEQLANARALIHQLLLVPPATISHHPHPASADYGSVLRLFDRHPSLRPTSTTLTLAIEWLRRRKHRGYFAYSMLRSWKEKWGDFVEDSRVRRKIASFALEENNWSLARKMINREYTCRQRRLETGTDEPNAPERWQQARDDALWHTVLAKYQKLDVAAKRGFGEADQRIWSSDFINSRRVQAGSPNSIL
ncbi:hypothetical protein FRB90_012238 [Tulasnella sp. 427]|nr:hypothetical protein FRB90_012238 [Tulasnella sp. 427]